MAFEKITVGIKTFLRDEHLLNAIRSVSDNLSGAQIIVVDDGRPVAEKLFFVTNTNKHIYYGLPFDSGFGAKSNKMARIFLEETNRDYLLIGSDDFDFTKEAAEGVLKLQEVLDNVPEVSIASGRVNNCPYEFWLLEDNGVVREIPVNTQGMVPWYYEVDLTVNFSLLRRDVLKKVRWDDDAKIGGGEHGSWFLDAKRAGLKVAFVPNVNINEQRLRSSSEYRQYRSRANSPLRPCFERRGVKMYILGNGQVDYAVS